MNWDDEMERELRAGQLAEEQENHGRARVCARRALGIVLAEWYQQKGVTARGDAVKLLEQFLQEESVPEEVFKAGNRLCARVRPDFTSPSEHPVDDARAIIAHLRPLLA